MKARFRILIFTLAVFLLASCASLIGERHIDIPLATLQQALSNRFPFNNRYLELFDITVSNPRVALQPDTQRIITSMDTSIAPPFLNRVWTGSFAVSGILRFDSSRNALVLGEPRMEKFQVDGLDARYTSQLTKVSGLLVEQLLKETPLYTFRQEDLQYAGTSFMVSKITTKADGLMVTFEPVK